LSDRHALPCWETNNGFSAVLDSAFALKIRENTKANAKSTALGRILLIRKRRAGTLLKPGESLTTRQNMKQNQDLTSLTA
jgi:hypothetical protein